MLSVTNAIGTSIGDTNPIRYRGYYYDQESGFYYLQSRYYDPNLCRFINADGLASTGQGFIGCNMFAYCLNNPMNAVDPNGTDCTAIPINDTIPCGGPIPIPSIDEFTTYIDSLCKETLAAIGIGLSAKAFVDGVQTLQSIISSAEFKAFFLASEAASTFCFGDSCLARISLPEIAKQYGLFQCREAAEAMKRANRNRGSIVMLVFEHAHYGFVCCKDNPKTAISLNGLHFGYYYNNIVYCNVYPEGKPLNDWVLSFYDISGTPPHVVFIN